MAENTIDTLQLEINSDANRAVQSIERLVGALYSLDKSLTVAGRTGLRNFQASINGAMESFRDFANLAKTPIKLNIQAGSGDNISKMKSSLERALGEVKFDTTKISNQLAENFNITGKRAIQNIDQQLQGIVEHFVDSFDGGALKLSRSALDNLTESISDSAKIAKSNLSGAFSGIEEEYEEFYNYFKNKKIYISDFLKNDIGKSEFKQALESNLSNITRNAGKGVDLNTVWEELSQKFPTIISPDTVNAADQVLEVLQKINEARDKIKPVSVNTLFGQDYDNAIKNIQESSLNAVKEAKENLVKRTDEIFSSTGSKINLDIEINEDKIVSDIQSAIRKASKVKYTPVNVELDVNADKIKNTITDKLKGLEIGNIPTLAEELSKISRAMVSLSGINLKDTGISTVINSISRLGKVFKDIPQDSAMATSNSIKNLAESLKSLTGINIPEITGVESLVSAMRGISKIGKMEIDSARISSAALGITDISNALRKMTGLTIPNLDGIENLIVNLRKLGGVNVGNASDYLPKISKSLVSFVESLNSVGTLSFDFSGVEGLVQNISRLGSVKATEAAKNLKPLKDQLLRFISGLNGIESLKFDVTGLSDLVSSISRLGGKAAGNAIPNIQNLAAALKQMMATLSTAPKVSQNLIQMTQAMAQLANSGSRVSNLSAGISSGFGRIIPVANKAKKSTAGLASALGKFYATYWIIIRGLGMFKKAIDISSDLTEVQNVVDVAFGDMKQKAEDLAATSIQDFGMSELTAKEISSRFQAMGMAMGFTQEKMSDMSIELTKLAADMASFYNVEQEAVARSLQSVFSGETEPLRKFGLDLTNATLQSWALSQGLNVNVQKMSQMEKTALRYRYVMANTAAAQGDFARTADTWHNSLVRLGQSFQQLGGVVGGVLVNAFKPFVSALNSVMQSVIKFAQTVANALGAIFGWTIEINSGGLATDFEAAGAGAEEMDKGTGGAAKNLKDMNKYIAAWHEVNNMTTDDNAGGGGGGGGGSGGGDALSDAAEAQFVRTEGLLEKYKSEIDSLYELGEYIGDTLTKAMNDIDWDSVYQKARNFGTGLAEFLNGLIDPDLFAALGGTIAGALNTALHLLDSFGTEFNWENFGDSIAAGVNGFFNDFNFELLANTLNTWAQGILDSAIKFIKKVKWDEIGEKIGNFLDDIEFLEIGKRMGKLIWEAINAGIIFWESMFKAAPVETTILTAIQILKFTGLDKVIAAKIGEKIALAFKGSSLLSIIKAGFGALFGSSAAESALAFMNPIATTITGIGTLIGGVALSISNFFDMWKNGFDWLNEAFMLLGIAITGVGAIILGAPAAVAGAVAGVVAAIGTLAVVIHDNWDSITAFFSNLWESIKNIWGNVADWFKINVIDPTKANWEAFTGAISKLFTGLWNGIKNVWNNVSGWFSTNVINPVVEIFEGWKKRVLQIGEGLWIGIQAIWIIVSGWFNDNVIEPTKKNWEAFSDAVSKLFTGLWDGVKNVWGAVSGWFQTNVVNPTKENWSAFTQFVSELFSGLWNKIKEVWNAVSGWFKINVIDPTKANWEAFTGAVSNLFDGLWKGIKTGVTSAMNAVIGAMEKGINFIISGINKVLGGFNDLIGAAAEIAGLDWGGVDLIPEVTLKRIGKLAKGGIVSKSMLALIGESGKEAVIPLERNTEWIDNVSKRLAKNINPISNYRLFDSSDIPRIENYKNQPSLGSFQSIMQMEMDAKMAALEFENRQLRESMEENTQILEQILDKGIILDNNEFTKRFKSSATDFRRRTGGQLGVAF